MFWVTCRGGEDADGITLEGRWRDVSYIRFNDKSSEKKIEMRAQSEKIVDPYSER